jgi:TRAP transporter TAXI family solute receptor
MIDHADAVAAMNKKYGNLYYADTIPKATYSGMATDNKMASVANILLVNANMPDDQAYKIVKAVFDHQKDLIAVHQEYANVTIAGQKQASTPIDFHPGAVKYIQEKGGNIKGSAAKGKK